MEEETDSKEPKSKEPEKKQEKKKKKKAESIDEKAEIKKSIEDLVYTETYGKAMNKDYKSDEYQAFLDNMKGGNETHNSGNFQGTK
jgi:hypothetical protein